MRERGIEIERERKRERGERVIKRKDIETYIYKKVI